MLKLTAVVSVVIVMNVAFIAYELGWFDDVLGDRATVVISLEHMPQFPAGYVVAEKAWMDGQNYPRPTPDSGGQYRLVVGVSHTFKEEWYSNNGSIVWGGIWKFYLAYKPAPGDYFVVHIDGFRQMITTITEQRWPT